MMLKRLAIKVHVDLYNYVTGQVFEKVCVWVWLEMRSGEGDGHRHNPDTQLKDTCTV